MKFRAVVTSAKSVFTLAMALQCAQLFYKKNVTLTQNFNGYRLIIKKVMVT